MTKTTFLNTLSIFSEEIRNNSSLKSDKFIDAISLIQDDEYSKSKDLFIEWIKSQSNKENIPLVSFYLIYLLIQKQIFLVKQIIEGEEDLRYMYTPIFGAMLKLGTENDPSNKEFQKLYLGVEEITLDISEEVYNLIKSISPHEIEKVVS